VDMLAAATPQQYANCMRILLGDPGVHSVMVILPPPPMNTAGGIAKAIIPVIYTATKPVVIALMGERLIQEAVEHFRAARVPEYRFPERAAAALSILTKRAETLATASDEDGGNPARITGTQPELARAVLSNAKITGEGGFLPSETVQELMGAYGIPILPLELAHSAEQAAEIAAKSGFPVALKLASPDIAHKSDIGGVKLHLQSQAEVRDAFTKLIHTGRQAMPEANILGVYVQRMLPEGQDVIVGAVQDPHFGPLVMFGSGGVEVEGLKDVEFALAPLTPEDADYLLETTWAGRKLHGYRNLKPADRAAVRHTLFRLAQLAADFPEVSELEINPLRVLPEGMGTYTLDVRARLQS
jgi:acetate---CoA ligase (ADP-forming)